jgi:DeoR family glycerol-3-phosphate regulon repressor
MSPAQRQSAIVTLIRDGGFHTVEELASRFSVTPQTIRRDVNQLCDFNILRRRRGGAELLLPLANSPYDTRRVTHIDPSSQRRTRPARRTGWQR